MVPIFGKFMSYITREKSFTKETKVRRAIQTGLTAENIMDYIKPIKDMIHHFL